MPVNKWGHLYYTKAQYQRAKAASALEYARKQGYDLKHKGGGVYCLRVHDSMVFMPDGRWYWNSRNLRGRAVECIMAYEGKSLPEAINILADEGSVQAPSKPQAQKAPQAQKEQNAPKEEKVPTPFQLPERAENMKRLFAYLCGTRKIDREVVEFLIHDGRLYEGIVRGRRDGKELELHNAVFIGFDETGTPRSAFQRGLLTDASYKKDVAGSCKEYPFCIPGPAESDTVCVFESAIDAMSHATLIKLLGGDWRDQHRIALGGVALAPLLHWLEQQPQVKKIGLALDTDMAGQVACNNIQKQLKQWEKKNGKNYLIFREPEEKDWNEYLALYLAFCPAKD